MTIYTRENWPLVTNRFFTEGSDYRYCCKCDTMTLHGPVPIVTDMTDDTVLLCSVFHEPVLNVPLGRKVIEYLEQHPERHDQYSWISHISLEDGTELASMLCATRGSVIPLELDNDGNQTGDLLFVADCGSTGCFAGWASIFDGVQINKDGDPHVRNMQVNQQSYAMYALGLTPEQAVDLFVGTANSVYANREALEMARHIFLPDEVIDTATVGV